jgi:hypothetical protein
MTTVEEIFHTSCSEGSLTSCKKLLRKSIDLNLIDTNGRTGLMRVSIYLVNL